MNGRNRSALAAAVFWGVEGDDFDGVDKVRYSLRSQGRLSIRSIRWLGPLLN